MDLPLILVCFVAGVASVPLSHNNGSLPQMTWPVPLSQSDYAFIRTLPRPRASIQSGFSYLYVTHDGRIFTTSVGIGTSVQVAGSPGTTYAARYYAAETVGKMMKYMPDSIFSQFSRSASVGVFSAEEKLTVYQEYAYLANTASCGLSCGGGCSVTCTFDGRKYEDIAGVGGKTAVVLDDNVVCNSEDPYYGQHNILAHELTHTIHHYALPFSIQQQITAAYQNAKSRYTWTLGTYAMSDEDEYFAEAATVFFGVNKDPSSTTAGMNQCGGNRCQGEMAGRENLRQKDPALYQVLSYVFTNNRPNLSSGLHICPSPYPSTIIG